MTLNHIEMNFPTFDDKTAPSGNGMHTVDKTIEELKGGGFQANLFARFIMHRNP